MLEVKNLKTGFRSQEGHFLAVDDISFSVQKGKTLGLVGESGCGKSVTSLSLLRLIQSPGKIESGQILFRGQDLLRLNEEQMRQIRGKEIALIFQEPMTSLNPAFTCGNQIVETLRLHHPQLDFPQLRARAFELLRLVGMPSPEKNFDDYPHQLSGGMRQRVMIALAISCHPQLLIADEPTTALDVTIQAQILRLMRQLQEDSGAGLILITHDLGVVAEMCDDVVVMYAGKIIESGRVEDIFHRPQHPYTRGLLDSIPHFEAAQKIKKLKAIPGLVPSMLHLPRGCRFQDRCSRRQDSCTKALPELQAVSDTQHVACYFPLGVPTA